MNIRWTGFAECFIMSLEIEACAKAQPIYLGLATCPSLYFSVIHVLFTYKYVCHILG